MWSRKTGILAVCVAALCPGPRALAADTAGQAIEEVVVTAQKRSENIQEVPLSLMAVSQRALEARGVSEARGLERIVPGLRLDSVVQSAGIAVRIRGIGANANAAIDPSVAPYVDGVFIPRAGAILTTFLDVESVEVLRGPQGTLFGRNATVGAISIRTHAPNAAFGGKLAGEVGAYGARRIEGFVNAPLSDALALRFAAVATDADGFIRNSLDDRTYGQGDTIAGRFSARWSASEHLTATVRVDYARTTGDGVPLNQIDTSTASAGQLANFSARIGAPGAVLAYPPGRDVAQFMANADLNDRQYGVAADVNATFGEGYGLRLISAYRDWRNRESDEDLVATPLDLLNRDGAFDSESVSGELQLISPKGALLGGRLDFVAGLYYFEEDYEVGETLNLGASYCSFVIAVAAPGLTAACNANPGAAASIGALTQNAKSRAAYIHANYKLAPTLDLSLGARQTFDKKSGFFVQTLANPAAAILRAPEAVALRFKDDRPSWRASLSWRAAPDVMAFVTYSTGYKSGGLNSAGGAAPLGVRRVFDS